MRLMFFFLPKQKCSDRTWKHVYAVLRPSELFLTRDKDGGSVSFSSVPTINAFIYMLLLCKLVELYNK